MLSQNNQAEHWEITPASQAHFLEQQICRPLHLHVCYSKLIIVGELAAACHVTWPAPPFFSSSLSSELNQPTINLSSHDSLHSMQSHSHQ